MTVIDEAFASLNGQAFYGLPPNAARVTLSRDPLAVPERIAPGTEALVPFRRRPNPALAPRRVDARSDVILSQNVTRLAFSNARRAITFLP